MVLLGTTNSSRAYRGCRGPVSGPIKIEELNCRFLRNILFNLCEACQLKTMAAIPPCTFTTKRIREAQYDCDKKIDRNVSKIHEFHKYFETMFAELSPLKYNSKLMNSIWGFYNRYSPHNVKKVNEAFVFNDGDLQQSAVNPIKKADPVKTLPPASLDNVWAAINVSQSH